MDLERLADMSRTLAELNLAAEVIDGVAGDLRDLGYDSVGDLYTLIWKQVCITADDMEKKIGAELLMADTGRPDDDDA